MSADRTLDAWATLAAREVVECDQCGYSGAYESERRAERDGWTFTERGTVCPWCCDCDICKEATL